jgi:hypothetical protein
MSIILAVLLYAIMLMHHGFVERETRDKWNNRHRD